eukprot:c20016_g1_i1 orf=175-1569(+)
MHGFGVFILFWCFGKLLLENTHPIVALVSNGRANERGRSSASLGSGWLIQDVCSRPQKFLPRPHKVVITDFGAVGDGITINTHAFQKAIFYIRSIAAEGGTELYVPAGRWLTGSFNLTSHLTLFLDKDAVILGSEDLRQWPVIDPLPSYGRGRELPGGRHTSLIHGENLTDVIITGANGTVDGRGAVWWQMFRNKTLDYTRGHLVELINSEDIAITNLTFLNSPFWTIHPVYCRNVVIQHVTILAPHNSPNTDGIDPDSSSNVCIEDCFISNGDDVIAVKSGWDEYGIAVGRPSSNIVIRRVVGNTYSSAGIALGSEMSGGISNIYVDEVLVYNARRGVNVKTSPGRGGYIRDIFISNVKMVSVRVGIQFTGYYGEHPDDKYDPEALPVVERIYFENILGENVTTAGQITGISNDPFHDIFMTNIYLNVTSKLSWNCSHVRGFSKSVSPQACPELHHLYLGFVK